MCWLDALARRLSPGAGTTVTERMAEAYEASIRGDYARALKIWGPFAHAGVPRAQNNVGPCFADGLGVARDAKRELQWLYASAAAGDRVGQRNCAAFYWEGVAQDNPRARALYRAAAEQGGSALAAGFLDAVRARLSAQGIAAGERRAAAPLPEPSS